MSPARFFTTILPDQADARSDDIRTWQASAQPGLHRLDAHLENREFMLESGYSITDIAIFGYVHVMDEAGLSLNAFPAIDRWINSVTDTEGFRPLAELGQPISRAA